MYGYTSQNTLLQRNKNCNLMFGKIVILETLEIFPVDLVSYGVLSFVKPYSTKYRRVASISDRYSIFCKKVARLTSKT